MRAHPLPELLEEEFKLKRLARIVDRTAAVLRWKHLTDDQAEDLIAKTRREVLDLFPGKGMLFDLVLRRRFGRIRSDQIPFGFF